MPTKNTAAELDTNHKGRFDSHFGYSVNTMVVILSRIKFEREGSTKSKTVKAD